MRALLANDSSLRTLNAHQAATVKAMADAILPRTGTPAASAAGAVEFIDLMLTEWYDEADGARFLRGLSDVDSRAQTLFNADFVACSSPQQADLLTWLGERMTEELERRQEQADADIVPIETGEDFYVMLRRLTLTAYFTSEAGATDDLQFQLIPGRYEGCAEIQLTTIQPSDNPSPNPAPETE
jgi:hypothetical protein